MAAGRVAGLRLVGRSGSANVRTIICRADWGFAACPRPDGVDGVEYSWYLYGRPPDYLVGQAAKQLAVEGWQVTCPERRPPEQSPVVLVTWRPEPGRDSYGAFKEQCRRLQERASALGLEYNHWRVAFLVGRPARQGL